ncbi:Ubiquitin-like protein 3-like [Homarus americanus]|uniref:Ubiquitin-like protein 3-like n=1 Tax=Homarus americanus TaxID=6706 RepID=A0A8J5N4N3_HOMAM|nr:Ubiquitin-like protein 3-like [Homarus americanus]
MLNLLQINLRLILVSGKTKEFLFSPSESAGDIAQFVFDNWPEEWADESVSKAEILRLIYQGRFLHGNVTLGALGLPAGKTCVMHLVPRENLPEPNSQGSESANFGSLGPTRDAPCRYFIESKADVNEINGRRARADPRAAVQPPVLSSSDPWNYHHWPHVTNDHISKSQPHLPSTAYPTTVSIITWNDLRIRLDYGQSNLAPYVRL